MSAKKPVVIHFTVSVAQVRTLADGGLRYTFDGTEGDTKVAKILMDVRRAGGVLEIAAVAVLPSLTNGKKRTDGRTTRSPIDLAGS